MVTPQSPTPDIPDIPDIPNIPDTLLVTFHHSKASPSRQKRLALLPALFDTPKPWAVDGDARDDACRAVVGNLGHGDRREPGSGGRRRLAEPEHEIELQAAERAQSGERQRQQRRARRPELHRRRELAWGRRRRRRRGRARRKRRQNCPRWEPVRTNTNVGERKESLRDGV